MNLRTLTTMTEPQARAWLESMRWPHGPICPHCGEVNNAIKVERHKADSEARDGLYLCHGCGKQFTVTVGTIFEGSHIGLRTWLMAIHMLTSSKKSLSALQLQRQLGLGSYRTAWHLGHRIRHMMANGGPFKPLTGIVEADETYIGGKPRPKAGKSGKNKRGRGAPNKTCVAVLVQRDGGGARARAVEKADENNLKGFLREHVSFKAAIHSDEWGAYRGLDYEFHGGHFTVNHASGEYARDGVHSNTAESFNGLFKRAILGSWHHISREHINRYLDEQCFRWTYRKDSDWTRTVTAIKQAGGVRLYYRKPKSDVVESSRLVADG